MVRSVLTGMVQGVEGMLVRVETDISPGLPMVSLFGSVSSEVREGKERVRTAMKNTGIHLPPSRITISLAPGDVKKSGTSFDLAIAVSLLMAMGLISPESGEGVIFLGELSLDGRLTPVHGVLPVLLSAREKGISLAIVPADNLSEASILDGLTAVAFCHLQDVYDYLKQADRLSALLTGSCPDRSQSCKTAGLLESPFTDKDKLGDIPDFSQVKGQLLARRALEIAVAGFHNVLLDGPPGVGKSMVASCLPGIMPDMTLEEKIETSKIYSVSGLLGNDFFLVKNRPFRAPSHHITMMGMFGGGINPVPGEISLAHHGVLFLDEFPEYRREILELLRVPLESHRIVIVRNNRRLVFPADFILIAAMNPCPCGYYPDRSRCRCSAHDIRRYHSKISGPMQDRMDLFVRCEEPAYETLTSKEEAEGSDQIKIRVSAAWKRQKDRGEGRGYHFNGRLNQEEIDRFCPLTDEGERLLAASFRQFRLSGRAYFRVLKTARTIADLAGEDTIATAHLEEALLYRNAISGL